MSFSTLFDVDTQLTFYGAYHSNRLNVFVHMICVPLLIWTFEAILTTVPVPNFIPSVHYTWNKYLVFDLDIAAIYASLYLVYYYALEPLAAFIYTPQWVLSLLTAQAFARNPNHVNQAMIIHGTSWVIQFFSHTFAEKRAPALVDNVIGAVVLAPFFVHLEILYALGYKPEMHKRIQNRIGREIAQLKKAEGDKKRAAQKDL